MADHGLCSVLTGAEDCAEMRKEMNHVLEYLERSARLYPDKEAFEDASHVLTFAQTLDTARAVGSYLSEFGYAKAPVAVFLDKNIESIVSFLGVLYSGNFYCPLDSQMPLDRIQTIMGVLNPRMVITDQAHLEEAKKFASSCELVLYEEAKKASVRAEILSNIRKESTELDPLYVLFTSGSTGVPKGVLVNQRVVTNYMQWLEETFDICRDDVFGNQAPLYFDVSVHDIYSALYFGAKMVMIPQELFGFPVKLVEYLNEKRVSSFLWVPSAMCIVANLNAFSCVTPRYLRHIMFAGEVLPKKQLDYWLSYLPDPVYANLYGPTETFVCTGYVLDKGKSDYDTLPIGRPIANSQALILDEQLRPTAYGDTGELYMRGSCLALGYYHNPERTSASFIQNPCNDCYPDRIYKTGDLVRWNEDGQLIYVSRKDFQIKHMGYRIELGEIEAAAGGLEGIQDCACVYDSRRQRIVLYYDGVQWDKQEMTAKLAEKLPKYMLPGRIVYLSEMPHNANGKIDRKQLGMR